MPNYSLTSVWYQRRSWAIKGRFRGDLKKVILQHTWGLFLQKNLSDLLNRSERSAHSFGLSPPPSPPLWCLTFRHRRSSLAPAKPIVASPTAPPLDETTSSFSSLISTCFSWRTPSSPHWICWARMLWESPWGGKKGRSVIATPSLWKGQKSGLVPVITDLEFVRTVGTGGPVKFFLTV